LVGKNLIPAFSLVEEKVSAGWMRGPVGTSRCDVSARNGRLEDVIGAGGLKKCKRLGGAESFDSVA
jgi:hypothetical protein